MLFHLLLIATSSFLITALPQNSGTDIMSQVDGFVFNGPTASRPFNIKQKTTPTTITSITFTSTTSTSTTSLSLDNTQFDTCVSSCPVTNEYNPVCGTDNMDYTNPGGLGCAQNCGKEVTLSYYGRCSTGRTG